jgi:glycosyltransferase involved in cell wall biosynthesis
MKKKILFMIGMMNVGGVEKSLLSLISTLSKEKYDVTILMLEMKGELLKEIPDWVRIEEAKWFKEIKSIILQSPYQTINNYRLKSEYLKIIDFTITYKISQKTGNRYYYYKQILKDIPTHTDMYDIAVAYQGPNDVIDFYVANKVFAKTKVSWVHFDVSRFKMNKKLYEKLYKSFNKIFVVSKEAESRLIQRIPSVKNKSEVFYNILSKKLIKELAEREVGFDDNYRGFKIVTVGRLAKEKGQDLAINTLLKLREAGYEIRWYCIGEGNQRKEFEDLIKKNQLENDFILLGAVTNPYPFIAKSDIYVQTSRHEGYCITLAEARCLNKPIVTTNFIGAYEQIVDGKNGYIVEANEEQLFNKIKYLIDNQQQRNSLTENLSLTNLDTTKEVYKLLKQSTKS